MKQLVRVISPFYILCEGFLCCGCSVLLAFHWGWGKALEMFSGFIHNAEVYCRDLPICLRILFSLLCQ